MSESRQKFDFLAPEDKSQKALRVDDMTIAKDNLQGAAQALAEGKMPSTAQVTEAIDSMQDSKPLRSGVDMSATGQRVAVKADRVLDSTKQLINEKNANNEIQRLIHHAKIAAQNLETDGVDYSTEKQSSEQNLQHTYSNMVVLSKLLVTSSEFRGLFADVYNLVRDVLRENDIPYAEHLPHSDDITNEDGSVDSEQAKSSAKSLAKNAKHDIYSSLDKDSQRKLDQVSNDSGEQSKQKFLNQVVKDFGQAIKPITDEATQGNTQEAKEHVEKKYESAAHEAKEKVREYKEKAQQKMDQTTKKLRGVAEDFELTEEQQDKLIDRFASILGELRSNPETRQAIDGMFDSLSALKGNTESLGNKAKVTFEGEIDANKDLSEAAKNAKKTVENFAGNHSLDDLFQMLRDFSEDTKDDTELKQLFDENRKFFDKVSREPQFVHTKEFGNAVSVRFDQSRKLLLKKYREPVNRISKEAQSFVNDLKEDPTTNRAIRDLQSLTREVFLDANGRPTAKFDLLQDFQQFVPALSQHLERLNIPRIYEKDDDGEYILDNISLICTHIVPKLVHVRIDSIFDTEEEVMKSVINVKLQGVQASAHEIAFYFKKNMSIFGEVEDAGLADVVIGEEGMDFYLKLAPKEISTGETPGSTERAFRVLASKCRVNDLSVRLRYTKHDFLYSIFNRMIQNKVKRSIENAVSEGVRDFLEGVEQVAFHSSLDSGIESKPLDPRPDGWKSDAFGA
ncbi:hypothetical protein DSO57_1028891 [Entomophthora muscae]|uniref:Uncharacterized protein n=1 Tax=Entomophthora muscae TaxID=34485 RepID=A0ACC2TNU3_9FUNG|nr:hypothetical protein DSO57_1028891 [Entomophthora muscae]